MSIYNINRNWSDTFIPQIKQILGLCLIGIPGQKEDTEHNTDLWVLRMDRRRIACRMRAEKYFFKYPDEFTIRAITHGKITEFDKIMEGWGDCLFYGFQDISGIDKIGLWYLLDLDISRDQIILDTVRNVQKLQGKILSNPDCSSDFVAFKISKFPKEFVIESGWGIQV